MDLMNSFCGFIAENVFLKGEVTLKLVKINNQRIYLFSDRTKLAANKITRIYYNQKLILLTNCQFR